MKYCPRCRQQYDDQQRFCARDSTRLSLPDPYRVVGGTLDGKYRIDALVGVGGFGVVYSAEHLGLARYVAFKILKPDVALQTPAAVGLFEDEAKTVARLSHENIVTIFDAGRTTDGLSYIAMEWLDGTPLDEELAARGKLSFERAAALLRQIAAALDKAHSARIVHRHLKPANVMLIQRDDDGEQVKVLDFGIAKVLSATAGSLVSRVMGTPHYASPEQWKSGAQIDGRADIYALGVMLYQMLAGTLPFKADSVEELIQLKLTSAPQPLRAVRPDAPVAVEELLMRMMTRDPSQRPQRISEVPKLFDAAWHPVSRPAPSTIITPQPPVEDEVETVLRKPSRKRASAPTVLNTQAVAGLSTFEIVTITVNERGKIIERQNGKAQQFTEDLGNGVKLEMVHVPGGEFLMGAPQTEKDSRDDERPQHRVKVPPCFIGKYPVTQEQWRVIAESTKLKAQIALDPEPSRFKGDGKLPVESVTWHEAIEFCTRLEKLTGRQYRLPSEAEWEYACRAGTTTPFAFGPTITQELVNYDGNYPYSFPPKGKHRSKTTLVGSLGVANAFGLFDTHGNVWEWCEDVWHPNYDRAPDDGSVWLSGGNSSYRVLRGGSYYYNESWRAASRNSYGPDARDGNRGFRVVVSAGTS